MKVTGKGVGGWIGICTGGVVCFIAGPLIGISVGGVAIFSAVGVGNVFDNINEAPRNMQTTVQQSAAQFDKHFNETINAKGEKLVKKVTEMGGKIINLLSGFLSVSAGLLIHKSEYKISFLDDWNEKFFELVSLALVLIGVSKLAFYGMRAN